MSSPSIGEGVAISDRRAARRKREFAEALLAAGALVMYLGGLTVYRHFERATAPAPIMSAGDTPRYSEIGSGTISAVLERMRLSER